MIIRTRLCFFICVVMASLLAIPAIPASLAQTAESVEQRRALLQALLKDHALDGIADNAPFSEAVAQGDFPGMVESINNYWDFGDRYNAASVAIYVSFPDNFRQRMGNFPGTFCQQVFGKRLYLLNREGLQLMLRESVSISAQAMDGIKLLGAAYPDVRDKNAVNNAIKKCY